MLKQRKLRKAFEQAIDDHGAMIQRIIASYERIPELQQDLLQEILLAFWQALPKFRKEASQKTYMASISHNRCIDHVAKESKYIPDSNNHYDTKKTNHCPQHSLQQSEQTAQLLNEIRKLPINQRQVISLFLEEFSYKEISEITGFSISNVGVLINRAKQQLESQLR